ncbi:MAG: iron-sulfur cluster assembly scaffold protein [Candidatus Tectomicrobia bacterium]|nr:iron-sulfur cluster assembly scaffold protein [Candidatus Tectomicrobia bacterium]
MTPAFQDAHHYNETVLAHIAEPRNVGVMENPDAVGRGTNPSCGDEVTLYLRFEGERVAEARMEILGCGAITASMSSLTGMVRGRTVEELMAITPEQIAESLGGLPRHKRHCAQLAQRVLRDALRARA